MKKIPASIFIFIIIALGIYLPGNSNYSNLKFNKKYSAGFHKSPDTPLNNTAYFTCLTNIDDEEDDYEHFNQIVKGNFFPINHLFQLLSYVELNEQITNGHMPVCLFTGIPTYLSIENLRI